MLFGERPTMFGFAGRFGGLAGANLGGIQYAPPMR